MRIFTEIAPLQTRPSGIPPADGIRWQEFDECPRCGCRWASLSVVHESVSYHMSVYTLSSGPQWPECCGEIMTRFGQPCALGSCATFRCEHCGREELSVAGP